MFRPKDRQKCLELFKKHYSGQLFHDDLYRALIRRYLRPHQNVLDAGCGRYMKFCKEFSSSSHVVGVDLETTLETDNTSAPFGIRGDLTTLPFAAGQFDMVISRSVVEHLDDPLQVFREFSRVLRPGGMVVIITPNKYDYVSIVAALTPYWLHRKLVSKIFQSSEDDVFPTCYRANTLPAMRKTMQSAGFVERELDAINHYPAYLMFSPVLFRLGVLYGLLTSMRLFRGLRASILCAFEKPVTATNSPAARRTGKRDETPVEAL